MFFIFLFFCVVNNYNTIERTKIILVVFKNTCFKKIWSNFIIQYWSISFSCHFFLPVLNQRISERFGKVYGKVCSISRYNLDTYVLIVHVLFYMPTWNLHNRGRACNCLFIYLYHCLFAFRWNLVFFLKWLFFSVSFKSICFKKKK